MPRADAHRLRLESVERFERDTTLRLPFRFGVTTVTHGIQAVIRVRVALPDGRTAVGVAAEALAAKWFEKNLAYSDAQNNDQLRQALDIAIDLYAIASCLSRTTRAIDKRGEEGARREIDLLTVFSRAAERRMQENMASFDDNDDELRKAIAHKACADGGYPLDIL